MKSSTEKKLKELCQAHSQLLQTIESSKAGDTSKVLVKMWDEQLQSLETTIIATLKEGFGEKRKPEPKEGRAGA